MLYHNLHDKPHGLPHVFGPEHLIFLFAQLLVGFGLCWLVFKKLKTDKAVRLTFRILGIIELLMLVGSRISICFHEHSWLYLIPDSFCSVSNILLSILMIVGKKDHAFFHFTIYLSFIGGILNVIYPTYLDQSDKFMYPSTIFALIHHALAMYYCILLVGTGYMVPTLKKFKVMPLGLCALMSYGIFVMDAFGFPTAMFIFDPLVKGTILTWYVVGGMAIGISALFMWLCDVLREKRNLSSTHDSSN